MAHFDMAYVSPWPSGVPAWLADGPTAFGEERRAQVARYEFDLAQTLAHKPQRLLHSLSVGLTAESLAVTYGVDPYEARVAGVLHDWAKGLARDETLARARELDIDLGTPLDLVEPLLHGIIAARELPERYPEVPASVWQAIERHTLGHAEMGPLDMVVFVADGIEPRRRAVPAIERQRRLVGDATLEDLFFTCFADGMAYVVDTHRYLYPGTLAIYNDLVRARAARATKEDA